MQKSKFLVASTLLTIFLASCQGGQQPPTVGEQTPQAATPTQTLEEQPLAPQGVANLRDTFEQGNIPAPVGIAADARKVFEQREQEALREGALHAWPILQSNEMGSSRSEAVQAFQRLLSDKGYALDDDANFGPKTRQAVTHFNTSQNITPFSFAYSYKTQTGTWKTATVKWDDVVHQPTWQKLVPTLKQGAKGYAVEAVHDYLGLSEKLGKNTVFDLKTKNAVINFQKEKGISPADGIVDAETWQALVARKFSIPTREQIEARGRSWVDAKIEYSQKSRFEGWRTDCSGFIAMAWNLRDPDMTPNADTIYTGNLLLSR
ncbi:hypothetical protein GCM10017783_26100 [Deinococcus piscis]|uniref:Peptidoglycan binding-like domain-containing protein n=1 Tax=Deinococcus piscis TaxID=394230 RepID=A0ABQ3KBS0_9DEIO|nr:peptidoglycan-binding protein [Deinococcus piscis]GHG13045.1 hypothetical protein GCM10017783_26100 [Deinococcus piscis]